MRIDRANAVIGQRQKVSRKERERQLLLRQQRRLFISMIEIEWPPYWLGLVCDISTHHFSWGLRRSILIATSSSTNKSGFQSALIQRLGDACVHIIINIQLPPVMKAAEGPLKQIDGKLGRDVNLTHPRTWWKLSAASMNRLIEPWYQQVESSCCHRIDYQWLLGRFWLSELRRVEVGSYTSFYGRAQAPRNQEPEA